MRSAVAMAAVAGLLLVGCASGTGGTGGMTGGSRRGADQVNAEPVQIGLVTKTDTNPYFIRMREAAITAARDWPGAQIVARAGAFDGDNDGQVKAVDELVASGVRGILITPSNAAGIVDAVTRAKAKGVLVIALDSETDPPTAVDATFATDNEVAGEQEGAYLKAAIGDAPAKIVMLNGSPGSAVDEQRRTGFMRGFGVAEGAPEIVASADTNGDATKAKAAMTTLLTQHPDLNGVYTLNEPAAQGAYEALTAAGKTDQVKVTTIDGSCPGVLAVRNNQYAATVMQFPSDMARQGVDAVMDFATRDVRPAAEIRNTGSEVVGNPIAGGVAIRDTNWGLQKCWG